MRVTSLGSGSNGNAFVVESGSTRLLVDVGIPIRQLRATLAAVRIAPESLTAVLISHEHSDHIRALPQVARDVSCPFFATQGTMGTIGRTCTGTGTGNGDCSPSWERIRPDDSVRIGDVTVTPVAVSHDAAEPVGFLFENEDAKVALVTDLGEPSEAIADMIARADLVVLESNYDDDMLTRGRYPAHLKRRIRGSRGHLSNADCAWLLANHLAGYASEVWLAHLSENNNRPGLALAATMTAIENRHGREFPTVRALPRYGKVVSWDAQLARNAPRQIRLF